MRTIADDILTWSWFSEPHGYDFNGFLITDGSGNLGIDPVEPTEQDLHELAQRGVSRILLTNRNHVRAANRLRASTGSSPRLARFMGVYFGNVSTSSCNRCFASW